MHYGYANIDNYLRTIDLSFIFSIKTKLFNLIFTDFLLDVHH